MNAVNVTYTADIDLNDPASFDVDFVYPPVPCRKYDYRATLVADMYEESPPTGWGPTAAAAIADLKEQLED
jgi:hypothetical protein